MATNVISRGQNQRQQPHPQQPSNQSSNEQFLSDQINTKPQISQQNSYMTVQDTKAKRITTYTLKLSKTDYEQQMPKIKECLRKIKQYYERFNLQYDYEISPLSGASQSNDKNGQNQNNLFTIKCTINFNKRLHAGTSLAKLIQDSQAHNSADQLSEKLEFFIQLLEHLNAIKDLQIESSWLNFAPESLMKAGNIQIILSNFILPINQISGCFSPTSTGTEEMLKQARQFMGQMSPEQMQSGICSKQSVIWQLGCLLYYILTGRWPFVSISKPGSNNGIIGVIRRNIVLCKYTLINDPSVQEQIFDRIFVELDENGQGRLTLDQLIEVVSLFLANNKPKNQQSADPDRKRFQDSEGSQTERQGDHSDQEVEVIEEDEYYNSNEDNNDNQDPLEESKQVQNNNQKQQQKQEFEKVKANPLKYLSHQESDQPNSLVGSKFQQEGQNNQLKQSEKFTVQEQLSSRLQSQRTNNKDKDGDLGYSNQLNDPKSLKSSNLQSSKPQQQFKKQNVEIISPDRDAEEHNFQPDDDHNEHQIANVPSFDNLPSMQSSRQESSRFINQDNFSAKNQRQDTSFLQSQKGNQRSQIQQKDKNVPDFTGSNIKDQPNFDDLSSLKSSIAASQNSPRDSIYSGALPSGRGKNKQVDFYNKDKQNQNRFDSESSFDMAQSYKIKIPPKGDQAYVKTNPVDGKSGGLTVSQLQQFTTQQQAKTQLQSKQKANLIEKDRQSDTKSLQSQSIQSKNQQNMKNESQQALFSSRSNKQNEKPKAQQDKIINLKQNAQVLEEKKTKYNAQVDDLPISFLDSARGSEKSLNQSHSQFGGGLDDQSSIQQDLETEHNMDDQIGFIISLNDKQCLGITIDTAQFILFTFDQNNKKGQHQTLIVKNENFQPIIELKQVVTVKSVLPNQKYVIATTLTLINIFQLDHQYKVQIQLIKQMKVAADCICPSFEEPCFYVAKQNKIGKAFIDISKDSKVAISSKKIEFYKSDQVKVSAMCYTILKEESDNESSQQLSARSKPGSVDGYMGIATSEYSFLILRINGKQGSQEVLAHIENAHESDITQVLALTDYTTSLSFVTLSLDTQIKIFGENGEQEYEMMADGQVITGLVPPQKSKDFFIVSSYNEELQQNFIEVYRKNKQILKLGPFADSSMILDLKLEGNQLFIPKSALTIERQELKGF